jgi:hypothetical protein
MKFTWCAEFPPLLKGRDRGRLALRLVASPVSPVFPGTAGRPSRRPRRLVKTGRSLAGESRAVTGFPVAESHLTRRLSGSMLRRIELLPLSTGYRAQRTSGCQRERRRKRKSVGGIAPMRASFGFWEAEAETGQNRPVQWPLHAPSERLTAFYGQVVR